LIQSLANRLANYVVKNDETANQEVLSYGFQLLLMAFITYAVVLISAYLLGVFKEMLIAIATYILMRTTIGGCHANSRTVCLITYSAILYSSIFLADALILSWYVILVLYFINVILLFLYAPGDTIQQPIVQRRFIRKILGLVFLSCLFALSLVFQDMRIETNILLFVSTATCILLHPYIYKAYGCEKSLYN